MALWSPNHDPYTRHLLSSPTCAFALQAVEKIKKREARGFLSMDDNAGGEQDTDGVDSSNVPRENLICAVCDRSQVEVASLPCCHVCTCAQCSLTINVCPLCGQHITGLIKIKLTL